MDKLPDLPPFAGLALAALIAVGVLGEIGKALWRKKPAASRKEPWVPPGAEGSELEYLPTRSLLTGNELRFLHTLRKAVPAGTTVAVKVRLADILTPKAKKSRDWQAAFNKISCKHADFTLCDLSSYKVLAVIELDDKSHLRRDRIERDEFFEQALSGAGIPVIRVRGRYAHDAERVRSAIRECLPEPPGPDLPEDAGSHTYGPPGSPPEPSGGR